MLGKGLRVCTFVHACGCVCGCVRAHTVLKSPGPWHAAPSAPTQELTLLALEKSLLCLGGRHSHLERTCLSVPRPSRQYISELKKACAVLPVILFVCKLPMHRNKTRTMKARLPSVVLGNLPVLVLALSVLSKGFYGASGGKQIKTGIRDKFTRQIWVSRAGFASGMGDRWNQGASSQRELVPAAVS